MSQHVRVLWETSVCVCVSVCMGLRRVRIPAALKRQRTRAEPLISAVGHRGIRPQSRRFYKCLITVSPLEQITSVGSLFVLHCWKTAAGEQGRSFRTSESKTSKKLCINSSWLFVGACWRAPANVAACAPENGKIQRGQAHTTVYRVFLSVATGLKYAWRLQGLSFFIKWAQVEIMVPK